MLALLVLINIVYYTWMLVACFWTVSDTLNPGSARRALEFMRETKPVFAVAVIAWIPVILMRGHSPMTGDYENVTFGLLLLIIPDRDDRWKRRRRKLRDKVAEVGGRLTVMPAT